MNNEKYSDWSIKIGGSFFDSFIYSGKLYLVTMDRKIKCVHWDNLIKSIIKANKDYSLGLHFAFLDSSALYKVDGKFLSILSSDQNINDVFYKKILNGLNFEYQSLEDMNNQCECLYKKNN